MEEVSKADGLSTDAILAAAVTMVRAKQKIFPAKHLDIGSGTGELIKILRANFDIESSACDYTDELLVEKDIAIRVANLNHQKLPFDDDSFDLVTCTEVIEHLEQYRETLREAYRVIKTGGTIVLTTPNILNLKSRMRYLFFGFFNLFGPLHFRESALHSTGGHITPIGLFYLCHSLIDAGFIDVDVKIDKRQSTSLFWLVFLFLPIKFFSWLTIKKEISKYKTIDSHNQPYVNLMNSLDILTGRTLIVAAKKP